MEEKKTLLSYKPGTILQGVYKSYGRFGFLITDDDHEDVYISDRDHLNAVNNDTVEVKTMKSETGRHNTEGRVMKVLERANDTFVCTYEMLKDGGEAVPIDEKVDMYIEILRDRKWMPPRGRVSSSKSLAGRGNGRMRRAV